MSGMGLTPTGKIRHLVLDDVAKAKAQKIIEYAQANHYVPGPTAKQPGDNPRLFAYFNSYRVVFSITESDGTTWRHLSCSVPGGKYPHPIAVFSLCELFGFTGWDGKTADHIPMGWLANTSEKPVKHIIIAQRIGVAH